MNPVEIILADNTEEVLSWHCWCLPNKWGFFCVGFLNTNWSVNRSLLVSLSDNLSLCTCSKTMSLTSKSISVLWLLFVYNEGLVMRGNLWALESLVNAAIEVLMNLLGLTEPLLELDWLFSSPPSHPPPKAYKNIISKNLETPQATLCQRQECQILLKCQGLWLTCWFLCNWTKLPGWDSFLLQRGLDPT